MSPTTAAAGRVRPAVPGEPSGPGEPAGRVHQAARALRRPPPQPDLYLLAAATAGLALATRVLAVPGSPFVSQAAYLLGVPGAAAWAVWSRRLVVPVPVLLVVLSAGALKSGGQLAIEQTVTSLATVTRGRRCHAPGLPGRGRTSGAAPAAYARCAVQLRRPPQ